MQQLRTVKVGDVCERVRNCNPAIDVEESLFTYIDIASVDKDLKAIIGENKIRGLDAPSRARQVVKTNDVLVSTVRPNLNGVAFVKPTYDGAIASTGFCVLRPDQKHLSPTYLYYWVQSKAFVDEMVKKATGANYPAVSDSIVKNERIPLFDLDTQRHIAAVLDRVDALRQKDRQLLAYYEQLPQAVFLEMFGDPVRNEKGWERGKIRDLITEAKYGTSKPAEMGGTYPYLRMNNITYTGRWDLSDLKYINLDEKEEAKYLAEKGDLLFNRTNSRELVGKTAVYHFDYPMAIAGYLVKAKTNARAVPEYISAYLNSKHGKGILLNMCKSIIGMANINAQEFQDIAIPIPPVELQREFAEIVHHAEMHVQKVNEQLTASESLFQSLLHEYFGRKA